MVNFHDCLLVKCFTSLEVLKNKVNNLNHESSNIVNKRCDILQKQGKAKNLMSRDVLCIVLAEI